MRHVWQRLRQDIEEKNLNRPYMPQKGSADGLALLAEGLSQKTDEVLRCRTAVAKGDHRPEESMERAAYGRPDRRRLRVFADRLQSIPLGFVQRNQPSF
jgi:hypothetical protein